MARQMHLGLAANLYGCYRTAWRHPDVNAGDGGDIELAMEIAEKSEKGLFDFMFAADTLTALWNNEKPENLGRQPPIRGLDPLLLLAYAASRTTKLGLAATVNTTYCEPYIAARQLATLDHLSNGRAAWNIVTGGNPDEALNYSNAPHPPAAERYERAVEFTHVAMGLWDSWDDDAFVCDKETGMYYDPARMRFLEHHGKYFHAKGPLSAPRSPQGRPVIIQAGASDEGRNLAAETADVVFSVCTTVKAAKAYYDDIKRRAAAFGRGPDEIRILPGVLINVAPTQEEAQEKLRILENCYDLAVGIHQLNLLFKVDLNQYDLDAPWPDLPIDFERGSRPYSVNETACAKKYTLRQTIINYGMFGHWMLTGTPRSVCDSLEEFFHGGGADGFMFLPPHMPGGLDDILELVIPELQKRGLYRTAYEGDTLRDHLGLKVPPAGSFMKQRAERGQTVRTPERSRSSV